MGICYRSGGVLTEGLRSMELRNKETLVRRVGLNSYSERRIKQRGHKKIQNI